MKQSRKKQQRVEARKRSEAYQEARRKATMRYWEVYQARREDRWAAERLERENRMAFERFMASEVPHCTHPLHAGGHARHQHRDQFVRLPRHVEGRSDPVGIGSGLNALMLAAALGAFRAPDR